MMFSYHMYTTFGCTQLSHGLTIHDYIQIWTFCLTGIRICSIDCYIYMGFQPLAEHSLGVVLTRPQAAKKI